MTSTKTEKISLLQGDCKRFLEFDLQTELMIILNFGSQASGKTYFQYYSEQQNNVAIYKEFLLRIVELPTKAFVVCRTMKEEQNKGSRMPGLSFRYLHNRAI